jgi:predicted nucleic acid-binding protein
MVMLNVYIDTSVIGGCFDKEFSEPSERFMEMVRSGLLRLVVSQLMLDELKDAPDHVRAEFDRIPETQIERVSYSAETVRLRDAYLAAGVVGPASVDDAHHVAIATVHNADMIASWNFKHLVNVTRMQRFNEVNEAEGYPAIAIHSPLEFIDYEES